MRLEADQKPPLDLRELIEKRVKSDPNRERYEDGTVASSISFAGSELTISMSYVPRLLHHLEVRRGSGARGAATQALVIFQDLQGPPKIGIEVQNGQGGFTSRYLPIGSELIQQVMGLIQNPDPYIPRLESYLRHVKGGPTKNLAARLRNLLALGE